MTIVSSKEFKTNQDKYLELALNEGVYIRNGNNTFLLIYKNIDDRREEPSTLPFSAGLWEDYDIDDRTLRRKAWGLDKRNIE